jgi:hypothetical protein
LIMFVDIVLNVLYLPIISLSVLRFYAQQEFSKDMVPLALVIRPSFDRFQTIIKHENLKRL